MELEKIFIATETRLRGSAGEFSLEEYQVFSLLIDGIRAKEIAALAGLEPEESKIPNGRVLCVNWISIICLGFKICHKCWSLRRWLRFFSDRAAATP